MSVTRARYQCGASLYSDVVARMHPAIIENACVDWSAHQWTLADLVRRFGTRDFAYRDQTVNFGNALRDILESDATKPAPYLRECYLSDVLPELMDEVQPLPDAAQNRLRSALVPGLGHVARLGLPELLVAGPGTHFPNLHWDMQHTHAFIMQLTGEKTFWLYAPDQSQYLYPRGDRPNLSAIDDFGAVDAVRWPLFAQARGIEVVVKPGELVFVPSGWWHCTKVEEISVAVTWSAVSPENWWAFCEDRYLAPTKSPLRKAFKRAYLGAINAWLRITRDAAPAPGTPALNAT